MSLKDFVINIIGLSNKAHHFDFKLDDGFFKHYGQETISKGLIDSKVTLDKRETFIEADFVIEGYVVLVCDRSLDEFNHPLKIKKRLIFKFGPEEKEISDEIMVITRDRESLDIGQYMYEFIMLEIPMRRIKPELLEESEESEKNIIYTTHSDAETNNAEETVDPRWEVLKKLKK